MENNILLYTSLTFFITSFIWYIYCQSIKSKLKLLSHDHNNLNKNIDIEIGVKADKNTINLQNTITELKVQIAETKQQSFLEGYDKARSEFSVKVFPYKTEHQQGDEGWLINDIYHCVELGYQYQLFVNGLPVLKPAIIIEEILEEHKKEVSYEKVKLATNTIEANLKPLIENSNGLLSLLKSKVK